MKRVKVKNFIYAGLDFIFDKQGNPWFLEANYVPGTVKEFKLVYGEALPLRKLADFINARRGKNLCIMISKDCDPSDKEESSLWTANELKHWVKNKNVYLCYEHENRRCYRSLKSKENKPVRPDIIFRWCFNISSLFECNGVCVINPNNVRDTVNNKFYTLDIVKSKTKVNTSATFFVRNKKELKKILNIKSNIFNKGFVLKPVDGLRGYNVNVFTNSKDVPMINKPELLEQRITPRLFCKKYWDARVFVVNGEFAGALRRASVRKVTNIAQGAKPYPLEKKLLRKLIKPSLEVVGAIDQEIERRKNNGL